MKALNILFRPSSVMDDLGSGKKWILVPLVAVLAIALLRVLFTLVNGDLIAAEASERLSSMPPESQEQAAKFMTPAFMAVSGFIASFLLGVFSVLLTALIAFLLTMTSKQAPFSACVELAGWRAAPLVLGTLVSTVFGILARVPSFDLSLAAFAGGEGVGFLHAFLGNFEPFALWSLALVPFGLVRKFSVSPKIAYGAVFALFLLWALAGGAVSGAFRFGG